MNSRHLIVAAPPCSGAKDFGKTLAKFFKRPWLVLGFDFMFVNAARIQFANAHGIRYSRKEMSVCIQLRTTLAEHAAMVADKPSVIIGSQFLVAHELLKRHITVGFIPDPEYVEQCIKTSDPRFIRPKDSVPFVELAKKEIEPMTEFDGYFSVESPDMDGRLIDHLSRKLR